MLVCEKKWTDELLIQAVKSSNNMSEVLLALNLAGGHSRIRDKIKTMNLDTSHWHTQPSLKRKIPPIESYLVRDSTISSNNLKRRLLNNGLLKNECSICKLTKWQNKPLILQLDHINGNKRDNRKQNLRLLCPNCHSQTETFCGRNIKGIKRKKESEYVRYFCKGCSAPLIRIQNKLGLCKHCRKNKYSGILSHEQLIELQQRYKNGESGNKLIAEYNISLSTFYNVIKIDASRLVAKKK